MATQTIYIKQNDLLPEFEVNLQDGDDVNVDITGGVVVFSMKDVKSTSLKIDKQSVTVVTALTGRVKYSPTGTDTDTIGTYLGEFQVTIGGKPHTFPNNEENRLFIVIGRELG